MPRILNTVRLGLACLLLFDLSGMASAQTSAQIKGAHVHNFIKFGRWPLDDGPFLVALLGQDDALSRELSSSLPGRTAHNRPIRLVRVDD